MRGFTIACILESTNSSLASTPISTTTNKLKRKNSDDNEEHQPNKRQTTEGKRKYLFSFMKISFQLVFQYIFIEYIIRLNQYNLALLFGN